MTAKDLGRKHTCWKCGTRFYDLKKPAPVCPKCGTDQRQSPVLKAPSAAERKRSAPKPPPQPQPEVAVAAEDLEEEGEEIVDEDEEPAADDEG